MLEAIRKETPEEELLAAPDVKQSFALTGLFLLALFYTLYFGRAFFLPIVLALLLNFLLSPVVRGLKKIHIPEAAGRGAGHPQPAGPAGARRLRARRPGLRLDRAGAAEPAQGRGEASATSSSRCRR